MNIAPGDKIWYGDGHEGWVVDKNTIYRNYPLQTDQLVSCLKDWFFGRNSAVKKIVKRKMKEAK